MLSTRFSVARTLAVAASVVFGYRPALGAESDFGAHVGLRVAHSDNVALTAGTGQSENIADVTSGFNLSRTQPRLDADIAYQIEGLFYDEQSDADEVFHQLDANSQFRIVPERLFLDLFALYDQTINDPAGKYSFNNLALTGNRTDIAMLGASPSVSIGWGEAVTGEVRYSYTKVHHDDPLLLDTDESYVHFDLANTGSRSGGTWSVDYLQERFDYEPEQLEFKTLEVELGYWLRPTFRLFTTQGLEGDYTDVVGGAFPASTGLDVHYWYVGFDWRPDERSSLLVSAGERSFGDTLRVEWNRQLRGGSINLSYFEEPSTFLRQQITDVQSGSGAAPIDFLEGARGNQLYLQERLELGFLKTRPKSEIGARIFHERRFDIQETANGLADEPLEATEEFRGAEANLHWQFAVRTSLEAWAQLASRKSDLMVVDDELLYINLEVAHQIRQRTQATLGINLQRSRPNDGGDTESYDEKQVVIGIHHNFGSARGTGISQRYSGHANRSGYR